MVAINKVAPIKESRLKHNSQEWFDGEIFEAIRNRDKLLKKVKRSRLHIDKELYNATRHKVLSSPEYSSTPRLLIFDFFPLRTSLFQLPLLLIFSHFWSHF